LSGIDTRALTRRLRSRGALRAILVYDATAVTDDRLVDRARSVLPLGEKDLVAGTSIPAAVRWPVGSNQAQGTNVVVVDLGIQENILRSLGRRGVGITVVPFSASAEEILALRPDGVVVSNGPGDPVRLSGAVETMRGLVANASTAKTPVFGICLGHQVLGLAVGGTTSRLPFGHHGANHPVLDART